MIVAIVVIGLGVVLIVNLLSMLCKKDGVALNTDHLVTRHTAVGTVKLRKDDKCHTRYTYGDKQ